MPLLFSSLRRPTALCAILAASALSLAASQAHAAFAMTLAPSGFNVLLTGTGSLNTTSLTPTLVGGYPGIIQPGFARTVAGDNSFSNNYVLPGISGPSSFGPGLGASNGPVSDLSTGMLGGLYVGTALIVPTTYVSGTTFTNSSRFNNTSIATLGATPGTYTWTWGSGATADSLTLLVVPEPSTWATLAAGVGLLVAGALRRQQ